MSAFVCLLPSCIDDCTTECRVAINQAWASLRGRETDPMPDSELARVQREIDTLRAVCESNKRAYIDAAKSIISANQALARIRALHHEYRSPVDDGDYCAHCNRISGGWIPYPCPTIEALKDIT
jgi:hypothetical protein